ncbi:hypothetical protein LCH33_003677 [Pseudomonas amygdali]|uniref:SIR2-like domain-containing protein n=1 Tax=Pseudomonas amygdali pv. hibisci TaxID=251723 RepID=A0AB34U4Y3_PSEA0|nr:hypothetical protein [Pseudomonas amygdali]KPX53320.1 Uncharacterized protein ALO67_02559 [Pseudomonas amygdali pv. hibisci]UBT80258.1 hypothetical protein LCH33_003677 [Pseudomonas amygdali]
MMDHSLTGVFLGAGASYDVGMPLVWDLTAELKAWLTIDKLKAFNLGWREQGGGHPDQVIDDFIMLLSREDMHYESILGYLEVQARRERSLAEHYHSLYSWLVEIIYFKLYFKHLQGSSFILDHLNLYSGIRHLYEKNRPLWVFSLNHDSVVEMLAKQFSIPLFSGFKVSDMRLPRRDSQGGLVGYIQTETIDKHTLDNGAMNFPNPPEKGIYLLKIHGALDVFTYNNGDDLLKLVPDGEAPEGVIAVLKAANEELVYVHPRAPGGKLKALNEILYKDLDGEMQFLRRTLLSGAQKFSETGSQVLPKSMLKHFRANIRFLEKLICIGYGFGDNHVNDVLKEWLALSSTRSIEIVSPNIKAVPPCILHLAPQVRLVRSGMTEYLDSIAGIERTEAELISKKITAASRKIGPRESTRIMQVFMKEEKEISKRLMLEQLELIEATSGNGEEGIEKLALWLESRNHEVDHLNRLLARLTIGS